MKNHDLLIFSHHIWKIDSCQNLSYSSHPCTTVDRRQSLAFFFPLPPYLLAEDNAYVLAGVHQSRCFDLVSLEQEGVGLGRKWA